MLSDHEVILNMGDIERVISRFERLEEQALKLGLSLDPTEAEFRIFDKKNCKRSLLPNLDMVSAWLGGFEDGQRAHTPTPAPHA